MRLLFATLLAIAPVVLIGCQMLQKIVDDSRQESVGAEQRAAEEARLAALEKRVRDLEGQLAEERARGRGAAEEEGRIIQTYEELATVLQPEIAKGTMTVHRKGEQWVINLADDLLFESGEARLKPAGIEVLKLVGDVLKSVPDRLIKIGGHTDNIPIGGKLARQYRTNLELSRARAANALRALEAGGVSADRLSAVGYAETRPVASNGTDVGRQKNRRVEIVVSPRSAD